MIGGVATELPLPLVQPGAAPLERADAARNRERILAAAAELIAERGITAVSMDDVASRAQVGTGTLYRRFGDRAGLAVALLDEQTRAFQDALLSGAPPLGPGAPATERLAAFGEGYIDVLERHSDLMAVAAPAGRDAPGPHQLYATHLTILLREAAPGIEPRFAAEALLAALAPGHYAHLRMGLGWDADQIRAGWRALVGALCR